jgi:hypothetical protein
MVELILDNLPVVLFIVIAIVIRTMQARFKERRKEAPPEFASALEPDDEEDETSGPAEAAIQYTRSGELLGRAAGPVKKAESSRLVNAEAPRFTSIPSLSEAKAPASGPAVWEPEKPAPAVPAPIQKTASAGAPAADKNAGGFFPRLEQLSPPQQAVVWAEILGKPKGME